MSKFKIVNPDVLENKAVKLGKKVLERVGQLVYDGYEKDLGSRTTWLEQREEMAKLFAINRDEITLRWDNASNIGLPVLTMACIQFQARAFNDLIPAKEIVKIDNIGDELEDLAAAGRVEKYMNYQLDYQLKEYRESMDTTLLKLPIEGTVVRKSYWNSKKGRIVSDWISAYDFIINNGARYLEDAERYTQNIWMSPNDIQVLMENGTYVKHTDVDKGTQKSKEDSIKNQYQENLGLNDEKNFDETIAPRHLIEQHVYLDLTDSGKIKEPYIVTMDYESKKIFRIVSRRNPNDPETIMEYFTPFHFIPNPDGFYGYGFGLLLKDANEAMNKILNDLIDCGQLQNTPMGFLLEGAGFDKGDLSFKMGEYKSVKLKVDDIRKAMQPLDIAQPSQVLYSMLGTLQQYQDRLTTVTETQTGDLAKSGTSATAVAAAVEQGAKVFNSIYRRIYGAMGEEFQHIYELNGVYLDIDDYFKIVIDPTSLKRPDGTEADPETVKEVISSDFKRELDIKPVADVSVTSKQERVAKAQFIYETTLSNPLTAENPQSIYVATTNLYKSLDIEQVLVEQLVQLPEPPQKPDLSQEEENTLLFKEQYTEALETQDHAQHMSVIADFKESPYAAQLSPNAKSMLDQHQREHIGFLYLQETQEQAQVEQLQGQLEE